VADLVGGAGARLPHRTLSDLGWLYDSNYTTHYTLAAAALESCFVPSNSVPVYLSIYLCLSADFCRCKRLHRRIAYGRLRMYIIYLPAHCVGVTNITNMSPRYNICPCGENITDIGVRDLAAPAKKTTDLYTWK